MPASAKPIPNGILLIRPALRHALYPFFSSSTQVWGLFSLALAAFENLLARAVGDDFAAIDDDQPVAQQGK